MCIDNTRLLKNEGHESSEVHLQQETHLLHNVSLKVLAEMILMSAQRLEQGVLYPEGTMHRAAEEELHGILQDATDMMGLPMNVLPASGASTLLTNVI